MKKYRVQKSDGTVEIIEALNIDDAVSKARSLFGQLPNDINNAITTQLLNDLTSIESKISDGIESIREENRILNWNAVYCKIHEILGLMKECEEQTKQLVGSMVKINKENEDEEI